MSLMWEYYSLQIAQRLGSCIFMSRAEKESKHPKMLRKLMFSLKSHSAHVPRLRPNCLNEKQNKKTLKPNLKTPRYPKGCVLL